MYKLKGHCTRGITCRFALDHITESGRNKIDQEKQKEYETDGPKTFNFYTKEMEADLRKRAYDFRRAEEVLNTLPKPSVPSWMVQGYVDSQLVSPTLKFFFKGYRFHGRCGCDSRGSGCGDEAQ